MRNIFFILGIVFMLLGVFGVSYTWSYDHRDADTLEEYATIDFKVARKEDGSLEGANFTLFDYRYDDSKLQRRALLYTDGIAWEMVAATKQTPSVLQNENKLFASLPQSSLKDIQNAKEVRIKIFYDNGQSIDLPLGKKELVEWQRKLRW